jgi:hypothetical protein
MYGASRRTVNGKIDLAAGGLQAVLSNGGEFAAQKDERVASASNSTVGRSPRQ